MSINPIELLKQKVTPVFLNDQDGLTSPKMHFYPGSIQFFFPF